MCPQPCSPALLKLEPSVISLLFHMVNTSKAPSKSDSIRVWRKKGQNGMEGQGMRKEECSSTAQIQSRYRADTEQTVWAVKAEILQGFLSSSSCCGCKRGMKLAPGRALLDAACCAKSKAVVLTVLSTYLRDNKQMWWIHLQHLSASLSFYNSLFHCIFILYKMYLSWISVGLFS